jgi:hypothetical protein
MRTADNIAARKAPEKARRDVLLKFGNPTVMREGVDFALNLDIFFRDVQYAFRKLRKTPAFVITVILTLALDIGGPSVYQVANFRFVGNTDISCQRTSSALPVRTKPLAPRTVGCAILTLYGVGNSLHSHSLNRAK